MNSLATTYYINNDNRTSREKALQHCIDHNSEWELANATGGLSEEQYQQVQQCATAYEDEQRAVSTPIIIGFCFFFIIMIILIVRESQQKTWLISYYNGGMTNRPVRLTKRLLQFNNLPFAYGEISDPQYSIVTKGESQPYTNNTHGSYYPTLGESQKLEATSFRATISFDFRDIPCEEKVRYARFIKRQLLISGKLWGVQNAVELLWTNARVTDISESEDSDNIRDVYRIEVAFELIDGYWRMAKNTRTFLCKYCPSRYQDFDPNYCEDMYDYNGICGDKTCLPCALNLQHPPEFEACDWQPLCYFPLYNPRKMKVNDPNNPNGTIEKLIPARYDMFGTSCSNEWYIDYSCEREASYFCHDESWGRKFFIPTSQPNNVHTFSYCSRTDLPTQQVRIRLVGNFTNPEVIINGDSVKLDAIVPGFASIGYGPSVYTSYKPKDDDPLARIYLPATDVMRTNTPAFELHAGQNCVTVKGADFGGSAYVYIDSVDITW